MNTYVNWLLIGFIVGIGFYAGDLASDYVYRHYLYDNESLYINLGEAAEITIEEQRIVFNKFSHNVVGFISNKADDDYHSVVLAFLIHDDQGLRHVCKERFNLLKVGRTPFETRCVFIEEPIDLYIQSVIIETAFTEK